MSKGAARLGLGTVQLGMDYGVAANARQASRDEACAILELAERSGIEVLDTAATYGSSEEVLGRLLRPGAPMRIVTKTVPLKAGLDAVRIGIDRSGARLAPTPVDTILVHSAQDLLGAEGGALSELLRAVKAEGQCRRIGISAYVADGPLDLARRFRPDVMQVPLSILDQRLAVDGSLAGLKELGVEVHLRSVFLRGVVFLETGALPVPLRHLATALARLHGIVRAAGATPLEAALAYALGQPAADVVLVGVNRAGELAEIVAAAARPPPVLDWSAFAMDDPVLLTPWLW